MREDLRLIESRLKEYMELSNDYCLKKAMVYEICYQYIDLELEDESEHKTKLNFNDMLEIADNMVQSHFLNEMLCETIQDELNECIKNKEDK